VIGIFRLTRSNMQSAFWNGRVGDNDHIFWGTE